MDLWLPWLNPADRSHRQAAFRKIILILMGKRTQVKGNFGKRNFTAEQFIVKPDISSEHRLQAIVLIVN